MNIDRKQIGFGFVEVILTIVIITSIVGLIGHFWWSQQNRQEPSAQESTVVSVQNEEKGTSVRLYDDRVAFNLPKGWVDTANEWCSDAAVSAGRNPVDSTIVNLSDSPKSVLYEDAGFQIWICVFDDMKTPQLTSKEWFASEDSLEAYGGTFGEIYTSSSTHNDEGVDVFVNQLETKDSGKPFGYSYVLTRESVRVFVKASLYTYTTSGPGNDVKLDDYREYEDEFKKVVELIVDSLKS